MQTRRPTRAEKERIEKQGLNWKEWLVLTTSTSDTLHILNKLSGKERHLPWHDQKRT